MWKTMFGKKSSRNFMIAVTFKFWNCAFNRLDSTPCLVTTVSLSRYFEYEDIISSRGEHNPS